MQTLKERLVFFLKQEEVSWAKFAVRTGLSRGFISTVTDNLTAKTLDKIASAFPTLNAHWLLTGDGEMLKVEQHQENANKAIAIGRDANGSKINIESQENTDDFVKIVEKYQTQIDRLLAIIEKLTDKPIR
jgi:hypothetical protein